MVGGISTYDTDPYAPKFFRYSMQDQLWENITNPNSVYTFRSKYRVLLNETKVIVMPGLDADGQTNENSLWVASLMDSTFKWQQLSIPDLSDDILARNSYGMASFGSKVYVFGGMLDNEVKNDYIRFDFLAKAVTYTYYASLKFPSQREFHSLSIVSGYLFLFGGDRAGTKLNDLWKYDLQKSTWEIVNAVGSIPSPRSHFAYASYGDIIVIWGGYGSDGYLNDGYIYNSMSNTWYEIESSSTSVPSPRIGACLDMRDSKIIIYGGKTVVGLSDEAWLLDLGSSTYTLIDSDNSNGPGEVYLSSCRFSTDHRDIFYVMLGIGENDVPSNGLYSFNYSTLSWTEIYDGPYNNTIDRADTNAFKVRNRFIYVGGDIENTPTNSIIYYDSLSKEYNIIGNLPDYFYAGAQVLFGNYLIVHGGGASIGPNLRRSIPNGNSFIIDLFSDCSSNEVCGFKCTPGTYLYNNSCILCPAGTYQPYFETDLCIKCPKGTYYNGRAAVTVTECYPCSEGYFNPYEGASYCMQCPTNSYCPAGSYNYTFISPNLTALSIQPSLYEGRNGTSSYWTMIASLTIGLVGLTFILIFFILIKKINWIEDIDIYIELHNHDLDVPMILRKTKVGGFFSIIFFAAALLIVIPTIITFAIDNTTETKSLVPIVVMDSKVSVYKTDLNVTVTAINYGAPCVDEFGDCKDIGFSFKNIIGSWSDMKCWSSSRDCIALLYCQGCQIDSEASINYEFTNRSSYASGFRANITSNSSIPNWLSSYEMTLPSSSNKLFRGSDPSVLYFEVTPSYFQNTDSGLDLTGYHISVTQNPVNGSQYSGNELSGAYNLYFQIVLNRNDNCLNTIRSVKQTWLAFISAILGSVFGIMGAVGAAMGFVEKKIHKVDKVKLENVKRKLILENWEHAGKAYDMSSIKVKRLSTSDKNLAVSTSTDSPHPLIIKSI